MLKEYLKIFIRKWMLFRKIKKKICLLFLFFLLGSNFLLDFHACSITSVGFEIYTIFGWSKYNVYLVFQIIYMISPFGQLSHEFFKDKN